MAHLRLWEPSHGEVSARARATYFAQEPGSRVYASAGLPGADWWVTCSAEGRVDPANVDLREVTQLYNEHDLWGSAFDDQQDGQ